MNVGTSGASEGAVGEVFPEESSSSSTKLRLEARDGTEGSKRLSTGEVGEGGVGGRVELEGILRLGRADEGGEGEVGRA